MPDFMIYPSLLDAYQRMLDSDILAEDSWNITPEGDYRKTPDEIYQANRQALLDAINRVSREPSEAADRGTVFNEIVDMAIAKSKTPSRPDITDVKSDTLFCHGTMNERVFAFETGLILQAMDYLNGAVSQVRCDADIDVDGKTVHLYGYADEVLPSKVVDIKTTSRYTFGKYERHWQRHLYPYCLTKSGDCEGITSFIFYVCKMYETGTPKMYIGEFYKEEYPFNFAYSEGELRQVLRSFIGWLESNREFITDQKIFGVGN